jgi:hypothetical protein
VSEFVANPPILDLNILPGQMWQVVLYAATNQTFGVQATTNLSDPLAWQLLSPDFNMTNSFRIFGPAPMNAAGQFFRWRQP